MTNTVRTLALAIVLAGTVTAPALAQRSNTDGLHLGIFLSGAAAEVEDTDETDSGAGISLHLGYGFSEAISLFARANAAAIQSEGFADDQYTLAHFDLGARYSIGSSAAALRPFVQGAFSGRAASFELDGETLDVRGSGFTAGGGLEYFVNPTIAIEAGLAFTFGKFNEGRLDGGDWVELDDAEFSMNTTRLDLGVSFHP